MRKKSIQQTGMHTERYDRAIVNCRIMIAVFLLAALLFVGGSTAATYSGSCGENLTWTLDTDTGVLEIEGTGKMTNYISGDPGWYQYRDTITSVSVGSGVTSIGNYAFDDCTSLTSVTIGSGVTTIGEYAFSDCTSLTSVTIGTSVASIGRYAFYGCTSLPFAAIPDSIKTIEYAAFSGCTSLKTVTIGNGVTTIGQSAFSGCTFLTSVTFGTSVTTIGSYAFSQCSSLSNLSIPDNVKSIGDRAFWDCTSLKTVTIGNGVTTIGNYAFDDCTSLTSVTIGSGVTTIGEYAFSDCTSLTSVTIGTSVTSIGTSAFSGCTSLTSVVIPDSVKTIGYTAFSGCTSLKTVTIGNGVTTIGEYAFSGCSNLQAVDLSKTSVLSSVRSSAFGSRSNNAMKSGSVIYVSDEDTAALFIAGTNYYAPNTQIIVGKPVQEITFIIHYDANGGTGTMADQTFTYNTTQSLSSNTFVKNASVFSGWATTAGGPIVYTDGQSVRNLLAAEGATLTLYAVWSKNENPNFPLSSIPLITGWNFISVPKTLSAPNNTAGSLFGSVDTDDRSILGYSTQTLTWVPIREVNEIIQPLNGYWIYAAAGTDINLTYPSDPTPPSTKTLYPGWNAVGLSADEQTMAHNALACLNGSWKTVIPWNFSSGKYDPAIVNGGLGPNSPERLMTLGNGYWVYVDSESTLIGLTA